MRYKKLEQLRMAHSKLYMMVFGHLEQLCRSPMQDANITPLAQGTANYVKCFTLLVSSLVVNLERV